MNWQDYVTVDRAVLVAKPVIKGPRLAVEFILGLIPQGWAEDEILRNCHIGFRGAAHGETARVRSVPKCHTLGPARTPYRVATNKPPTSHQQA